MKEMKSIPTLALHRTCRVATGEQAGMLEMHRSINSCRGLKLRLILQVSSWKFCQTQLCY